MTYNTILYVIFIIVLGFLIFQVNGKGIKKPVDFICSRLFTQYTQWYTVMSWTQEEK